MIRFVIVLCVAVACGGKKTEEPPTAASGSQPATGSAPATPPAGSNAAGSGSAKSDGSAAGSGSATAAVPTDPDLPAAEDFEQEATIRITEKNIEAEVKALEKEIGEN